MKNLFLIVCFLSAQGLAREPAHYLLVDFAGVSADSSCPVTGAPDATCIVSGNFGGGMYFLTLQPDGDYTNWVYSDQEVTTTECWRYPGGEWCQTATGIVITAVLNYEPYALYIYASAPTDQNIPEPVNATYFKGGVASLGDGWIYIDSIPNENQNCFCYYNYPIWNAGVGGIVRVAEIPGCAPLPEFLNCGLAGIGNCWRKQISPPDDCQKYDINFNNEIDLEDLAIILSYGWMSEE